MTDCRTAPRAGSKARARARARATARTMDRLCEALGFGQSTVASYFSEAKQVKKFWRIGGGRREEGGRAVPA